MGGGLKTHRDEGICVGYEVLVARKSPHRDQNELSDSGTLTTRPEMEGESWAQVKRKRWHQVDLRIVWGAFHAELAHADDCEST